MPPTMLPAIFMSESSLEAGPDHSDAKTRNGATFSKFEPQCASARKTSFDVKINKPAGTQTGNKRKIFSDEIEPAAAGGTTCGDQS